MVKEKPQNSTDTTSKTEKKQTPQRMHLSDEGGISNRTLEIEDEIQLKRREIYAESLTRQFLRTLVRSGKKGEIVPFYHPASGFTYEKKMAKKGDSPNRYTREFLENLVRLDIMQKSFYDTISTCPKCESPAISLHPRCSKCRSQHIEKISLTEHIPCGYIDQKDKYKQSICPKCGKCLIAGEYRNMGR